ncbi:interleukin-17B-like isoform X1 [Polypterus senegalus]|uniref:interleukin-17B-like isoform X1 n=1 Tax=Polypterus senegalus TaxID=55291 RepID=UPI001962DACD|nr:interleukin-17B-like isoform X1 [Polypterus senegalus]
MEPGSAAACVNNGPFLLLLLSFCLSIDPLVNNKRRKTDNNEKKKARGIESVTTNNRPADPVNSVTTLGKGERVLEEDFERSIDDMVQQLRNNSELSGNKCEISLRIWVSNRRSLSPWSYRVNHDENRIPVDIPEAHCLCSGCINPFTMQEDRTMTSVPIYTKIPVKRILCSRVSTGRKQRKRKKNCMEEYKAVMESIAVGCTCIF